jgi:dynein heavy chain
MSASADNHGKKGVAWCTGPTGTGKTACIKAALAALQPQTWGSVATSFSAQTSAGQAQDAIEARLDKRHRGAYGPPRGTRLAVFVDDLNMPAPETYGSQV